MRRQYSRPFYRQALQAEKPEDDPIVWGLVKILRKVNKTSAALRKNLGASTEQWAQNLEQIVGEAQQTYDADWDQYEEALMNLLEVSGNLRDLDEGTPKDPDAHPAHWIEFLEDQYIEAAELELQADEAGYPEDHAAFKLVRKIDEILNMEMD